jgi:predicted RNA binding protein YcfA (HicA-like mRNA interferase family)
VFGNLDSSPKVHSVLKNSMDVIRRLKADGFELVRVRGSHHIFKHPASGRRVTLIHPKKDFAIKTIRSVYDQAGWRYD